MYKYGRTLIQKYFDEQSFVGSDIESYNFFMEKELNKIIAKLHIHLRENRKMVKSIGI